MIRHISRYAVYGNAEKHVCGGMYVNHHLDILILIDEHGELDG